MNQTHLSCKKEFLENIEKCKELLIKYQASKRKLQSACLHSKKSHVLMKLIDSYIEGVQIAKKIWKRKLEGKFKSHEMRNELTTIKVMIERFDGYKEIFINN